MYQVHVFWPVGQQMMIAVASNWLTHFQLLCNKTNLIGSTTSHSLICLLVVFQMSDQGLHGSLVSKCRVQLDIEGLLFSHVSRLEFFCSGPPRSQKVSGANANETRQRKAWHPLAWGQSRPWPMNQWPKINRGPPLIIHNLHVKFESDWAKTVVAIVSTRFYTKSATVDLDLWPCDQKIIVFLLSSCTTYMWSLKVIGQQL